MIGILAILLIAGIGVLFYHFDIVEGTIVPGDGDSCEGGWFTPTSPETKEPYTSIDGFRSDVAEYTDYNETQVDQFIEVRNAELRSTENGTVVQLEEVCA